MRTTTRLALAAGIALAFGLAGAASYAQPGGGWGLGAGCPYGAGMGYGPMGPGYGRGPGYGMGPGHGMGMGYGMGYHMGPRYGAGPVAGVVFGTPEAVNTQLAELKSALAITEKQQAAWDAFAESAKKEAGSRQAWFEAMHEDSGTLSSSEWLARRAEAMKQRQSDMAALSSAYSKLYEGLTPEQRSILDQQRVALGPRNGPRSR